jgi:hypothetical protein
LTRFRIVLSSARVYLMVSSGVRGAMRRAAYTSILAVSTFVCSFNVRAQSNVYSLSFYSGGVSSSVVHIGSWPKQFDVYRDSYWADSNGCVTSWIGNPRGIQPGDKHHLDTRVYLFGVTRTIRLPPAVIGTFAAGALLTVIALVAGFYYGLSRNSFLLGKV